MQGTAQGGGASWRGAQLQVVDPGRSAKERHEIWTTMESAEQLDAARYPEIVWRLDALQRTASGFALHGTITLHGVRRTIR